MQRLGGFGQVQVAPHGFLDEAKLMKTHSFPDEKAHLALHDDLVKKALDYKRRFEAGEAIGVDLVNFVRDWLTHHILKVDRAYVPFLKAHGVV